MFSLAIALGLHQNLSNQADRPAIISITDGLPTLVELCQYNIGINFSRDTSQVALHAQQLSWGDSLGTTLQKYPDIVLAADCAYIEESFPLLVKTLEDLIGEETKLWFCYKKRRKRDKDCIKMIGKAFDVQVVRGQWERDGVWLFEVKRLSRDIR